MKPIGWVKLHRQITENSFLMHDPSAFMMFMHLLLRANSKGQWSGGRKQLSEIVGLKEGTTYDALKRLERQQIVNIKSNSHYSVISICNWSKYQSNPNSQSNNSPTIRQQHDNTLLRIENKDVEANSDNRGKQSEAKERVRKELKEKGIIK